MAPAGSGRDGLTNNIRRMIDEQGMPGQMMLPSGKTEPCTAITFRDYMAACLYDETYGYYTSGERRVGKDGDFYTSASIGNAMGAVLANYIRRLKAQQDSPLTVFEWGAGTGRLAIQLIEAYYAAKGAAEADRLHFVLVDGHPAHREAARQAIDAAGFGHDAEVLTPEQAERRLEAAERPIVLANELLDAFPVRRIKRIGGQLREIGTAWDEHAERFRDAWLTLSEDDAKLLAGEGLLPAEGQTVEWGTDALAWLTRLCARMHAGTLLFIDYGDVKDELLAPHRMNGTLLAYANHQAHDDPYVNPGGQDLTAHVNFTAVREAAERLGWSTIYYATQKQFLLDYGVLELLQEHYDPNPFSEQARRNRAVRQLLISDGMSELFKVIIMQR